MTVKILVAEDSATMRKIFEMTFAGEDAEVIAVDSGDAALAKAREVQPDVVLADSSMQGTDGYALAQALKSDSGGQPPAVIVLASQHAPYDADRGQASGVDDHVLKPFDTQSVIDKVKGIVGKPRAAAQAAAPAAKPAAAPPKPPAPPAPPPPPAAAKPAAPAQPPRSAGGPAPGKSTLSHGPSQGGAKPAAPAAPPQAPAAAKPAAPAAPSAPSSGAAKPAAPAASPQAPAAAKPAAPPRKDTMDMEAPSRPPAAGGAADAGATGDLAERLKGMGLSQPQVDGVLKLTHEVIEQVVWEVVPDLAETIIQEEIRRLTEE